MCCSFFQKILSMRLPSSTFQFISSEELNYHDIWLTSLTLPFPRHPPPQHTHTPCLVYPKLKTSVSGCPCLLLPVLFPATHHNFLHTKHLLDSSQALPTNPLPHTSLESFWFHSFLQTLLPLEPIHREGKKGSGITAHGCIFYLPPSSSVPSHVTEEHNSFRLTKRWWSSVMRMLNYPWGADSSFLVQSEYLINMCVITRAAPTIALCTQNPYIHSVLIYMSDFSGTRAVCHGLCGMIGRHWTRRWNRLSGYVCLTIR